MQVVETVLKKRAHPIMDGLWFYLFHATFTPLMRTIDDRVETLVWGSLEFHSYDLRLDGRSTL